MVNKQTAKLMGFFPVRVDALRLHKAVDTNRRVYQDIKTSIGQHGMSQPILIDEATADNELSRVYVSSSCSIRAHACIALWRERGDSRLEHVTCYFGDVAPAPSMTPRSGGRG